LAFVFYSLRKFYKDNYS